MTGFKVGDIVETIDGNFVGEVVNFDQNGIIGLKTIHEKVRFAVTLNGCGMITFGTDRLKHYEYGVGDILKRVFTGIEYEIHTIDRNIPQLKFIGFNGTLCFMDDLKKYKLVKSARWVKEHEVMQPPKIKKSKTIPELIGKAAKLAYKYNKSAIVEEGMTMVLDVCKIRIDCMHRINDWDLNEFELKELIKHIKSLIKEDLNNG